MANGGQQVLDRKLTGLSAARPVVPETERYRLSDPAGMFDKDMLVSEMIRRLRCQECGEPAETVALVQVVGIRRPVLVRALLLGSER